jgi:hypothetical protein
VAFVNPVSLDDRRHYFRQNILGASNRMTKFGRLRFRFACSLLPAAGSMFLCAKPATRHQVPDVVEPKIPTRIGEPVRFADLDFSVDLVAT